MNKAKTTLDVQLQRCPEILPSLVEEGVTGVPLVCRHNTTSKGPEFPEHSLADLCWMQPPRWRKGGKISLWGIKKSKRAAGSASEATTAADAPTAGAFDDTLPFTGAKQLLTNLNRHPM